MSCWEAAQHPTTLLPAEEHAKITSVQRAKRQYPTHLDTLLNPHITIQPRLPRALCNSLLERLELRLLPHLVCLRDVLALGVESKVAAHAILGSPFDGFL